MLDADQESVDVGPPAQAARHSRNLLILHTRTKQDLADWVTVKEKIEALAPDIEVRIDSNGDPSPETPRWQTSRPSLVFSPFRRVVYQPPGGTVYIGRYMGKGAEFRHLARHGLPVPLFRLLVPELPLKPEVWGEYVIVKPARGMRGKGVRLFRTDEVRQRIARLTANGRRRVFVQKFIDHVDAQGCPRAYRVLTLFGEPLYMTEHRWTEPRRPLAEIAADPAGKIATNSDGVSRDRSLVKIPDVLALARRVANAFPRIPCLGQDIIREAETDRLYVLETNPGGAIWHLSSDYSRRPGTDPEFAKARYAQFDALDVVAKMLIVKTRTEAS